ncbi:hypothetical protein QBC36DRAFT_140675 [Triangularia setosa]|uniref:Uncharacterized protein n=1 Tax=Triangularia setosa TaxID=2587417 RepID=A0AAN6WBF9_9PEZI|nr:hypothetical protein QBC36DRAFT_140675 [Podospora setosa]
MERVVCRAASTYKALIPSLLSQAYSTRPPIKQGKSPSVKQSYLPSSVIWEASQAVKDFATLHKIYYIDAIKTIPKQTKINVLRIQACRRHAFDHQHEQYLQYQEHPLTRKILWRCYEWKVNRPLWLYATAIATDGGTAVMRRQAECKVLAAIKAAIKANGFDADGTALDGRGRVIYGTMRLVIWSPRSLLNLEWSELVNYLANLVKYQILPTYVQMSGYPRGVQRPPAPKLQTQKSQIQKSRVQKPRIRKQEGFTIM